MRSTAPVDLKQASARPLRIWPSPVPVSSTTVTLCKTALKCEITSHHESQAALTDTLTCTTGVEKGRKVCESECLFHLENF